MTIFVAGRRSVIKDAPSAAIIRPGRSNTRFGAGHPVHARTAAKPTASAAKTPHNDRFGECVSRPAARLDTMTLECSAARADPDLVGVRKTLLREVLPAPIAVACPQLVCS